MNEAQKAILGVIWEELNGSLHELNEIREKADDSIRTVEYCVARLEAMGIHPSDDTYDEFGVNTKNSFNTPPEQP
jgi:hypothetical protein